MTAPPRSALVTSAWAGKPLEGTVSGDLHVVISSADRALVALIDGLGHGPEAAFAAREAAAILTANERLNIRELITECHDGLRKTRGAAMTVATFDRKSSTMEWSGVGNVEAVLFRCNWHSARAREALITRNGVVGYRLPTLRVTALEVFAGDLLLLATDGIRTDFSEFVEPREDPQFVVDRLLARCAKGSDDALVLAVRYDGSTS